MSEALQTKRFFDFGAYRLDPEARVLLRDGDIVPLTPKVLDTLTALVERRGELVSKSELLQAVWPDTFVEESNLSQNVSVIRRTLGRDGDGRNYVETVSKRGYRFVAEVRLVEAWKSPAGPTASEPEARHTAGMPHLRRPTIAVIGAALLLGGATAAWYYGLHREGAGRIRSLAVLPLRNLSGDPGQDYFAEGITEMLTTEISRASPLRVISRSSAAHYGNSSKSVREMARELGVDALLEGSVERSGNRLRITAHLIDAASDRHLWAETYDREITDVFVLQQEIGRAVAHEIRARITPGNRAAAAPMNRAAFDHYLRARYYLDKRTAESISKAISSYQGAIAEDPAYARAYAGLADCYNQLGTVMIGGRSPTETRRLAMAAAARALEIDPELAEAHAALAYSNLYEWNWDRAREGLHRAITLNPNYAPAHLWLAHYLAARGRSGEALQEVRLARDLDPLSPIIQTQVGWILSHAGRYQEAIVEFRKALDTAPDYEWATWQLGRVLTLTNNATAAIEVLQGALERDRSASALASLGRAYAVAGRRDEALKVLQELVVLSHERYVPPHCFVTVYTGLRDREKTFQWLERSYQERSNSLLWMGVLRDLDWLRSDARFENLLHRVGLK